MQDHPFLVSLEGIARTGKTEIAKAIEEALHDRGFPAYAVHDPPLLDPWEDVRKEYVDRETDLSKVGTAFLCLAACLDGVQREVIPALTEETFVIADRYVDSWVAHNAHRLASILGTSGLAMGFLMGMHERLSAAGMLPFPRRTWFIREDPKEALLRAGAGPKPRWDNATTLEQVADLYEELADQDPTRIRLVDARGRSPDEVRDQVVGEVVGHCIGVAATY